MQVGNETDNSKVEGNILRLHDSGWVGKGIWSHFPRLINSEIPDMTAFSLIVPSDYLEGLKISKHSWIQVSLNTPFRGRHKV